jgi:hypothetical protein
VTEAEMVVGWRRWQLREVIDGARIGSIGDFWTSAKAEMGQLWALYGSQLWAKRREKMANYGLFEKEKPTMGWEDKRNGQLLPLLIFDFYFWFLIYWFLFLKKGEPTMS